MMTLLEPIVEAFDEMTEKIISGSPAECPRFGLSQHIRACEAFAFDGQHSLHTLNISKRI